MSQSLYAPGEALAANIQNICKHLGNPRDRIEIPTLEHGTLVLLSKTELEHLESALELLADGERMRAVCAHIARLCDVCENRSSEPHHV